MAASSELDTAETPRKTLKPSVVILLVVIALFAGVLLAKGLVKPAQPAPTVTSASATSDAVPAAGGSITSVQNDAVADYDAALKTGQPVYVLFHSLTCNPCVEISAVADKVMPDYDGRVVFVNAITDSPSGQQLSSKFQFQYIPQSYFLTPDGVIAESFNGAMDETQMRGYLDKLTQAQ